MKVINSASITGSLVEILTKGTFVMRKTTLLALIASAAAISMAAPQLARAQCTVPYQLTNGQTADATQVMGDINALLSCLNGLVPGTPGGPTNAVQYNAGSGNFGGVGPLTDGQLVIGSTGTAPQAGTLTAGTGIAITPGPGSVTISATAGSAGGLFNQVLSQTPTSANTGLSNWLNQGSATVSDSPVGVMINAPSTSGAITARYMAAPTAPYKITALVAGTHTATSYNGIGIGWYDGVNKLHVISYTISNSNGLPFFEVSKWNSPTSYSSDDFTGTTMILAQPTWVQIADDGTNVSFAFSEDGANFLTIYSVAKASGWLGASGYQNVIFYVNPQGGQTLATLMSWVQN